jgi:excisionase family DNA binding protein
MGQNAQISSSTQPLFEKEILRVKQVAELLEYSTWHVYRLVSQQKIPFRKKGKTLFFLKQEILDWVNQGDF